MIYFPQPLSNGLLMYGAQSTDGQGDFIALYVQDGRLVFSFDTGTGAANIVSGQLPGGTLQVIFRILKRYNH